MGFAENLKQIRKENGLSQEELAEMMEVSRQAVSKWELGESYPEVEKLLLLSQKFNVSLDSLFSAEIAKGDGAQANPVTGSIIISSPTENVVANCYKVMSSQRMKGGKNSPQYALYGASGGISSFWGEPTAFLGWYASLETISEEISQIRQAIRQGNPTYDLKYSVRVERKWLGLSMVEE